jgi:hypothetical protein
VGVGVGAGVGDGLGEGVGVGGGGGGSSFAVAVSAANPTVIGAPVAADDRYARRPMPPGAWSAVVGSVSEYGHVVGSAVPSAHARTRRTVGLVPLASARTTIALPADRVSAATFTSTPIPVSRPPANRVPWTYSEPVWVTRSLSLYSPAELARTTAYTYAFPAVGNLERRTLKETDVLVALAALRAAARLADAAGRTMLP